MLSVLLLLYRTKRDVNQRQSYRAQTKNRFAPTEITARPATCYVLEPRLFMIRMNVELNRDLRDQLMNINTHQLLYLWRE